jgi:hypothetical protein
MSTAIVLASSVAPPANITPAAAKALDPTETRRQRGMAIAAVTRITQKNGQWIVPSQKGNGSYRVILDPPPFVPQCTCKDFAEREQPCKHVYAVRFVIERESQPESVESVATIAIPDAENAPETLGYLNFKTHSE